MYRKIAVDDEEIDLFELKLLLEFE